MNHTNDRTIIAMLLVTLLTLPGCYFSVAKEAATTDQPTRATVEPVQVNAATQDDDAATEEPVRQVVESNEADDNAATEEPARQVVESRKSSAAARAKGEINFDDLHFDIEKDQKFARDLLNEDVESLHAKKVKIRGYILPATLFSEKGIKQFVLVRDNQECCFGPGAALFDCVMVEMVPGKTTDFVTRPVTVEGKFQIDTESYKYPGGKGPRGASHLAIFKIAGENVK